MAMAVLKKGTETLMEVLGLLRRRTLIISSNQDSSVITYLLATSIQQHQASARCVDVSTDVMTIPAAEQRRHAGKLAACSTNLLCPAFPIGGRLDWTEAASVDAWVV